MILNNDWFYTIFAGQKTIFVFR